MNNRPKRAATQKPIKKQNIKDLDLSDLDEEDESDGDFSSQSSDEYDPGVNGKEDMSEEDETFASEHSDESGEEEESSPEKDKNTNSRFSRKQIKSNKVATLRKEVINKFKNSSQRTTTSGQSSQKLSDILMKAEFKKFKHLLSSDEEKVPEFDCSGGLQLSDSSDGENDEKPKSSKAVLQKIPSQDANNDSDGDNDKNLQKMKEIAAKLAGPSHAQGSYTSSQKENVNVADLLAMGEEKESGSSLKPKISKKRAHASSQKAEESADSDWEDVEDDDTPAHKFPKEGVEIILNEFGQNDRGKTAKPVDVEAQLKRKFNRRRKEYQENLHKTELLSWICHGNFVNERLNDMNLIKNALKLLPKNHGQCYPKDKTDKDYFKQITTWFKQEVSLRNQEMYCTRLQKRPPLMMSLALQMKFKAAICRRDYVLIYIILLRAIGIQCRMVQSIVCDPKICPKSELMSLALKKPIETAKKSTSKSTSKKVVKGKAMKLPQLDGGDNDIPEKNKKSRRSLRSGSTNEAASSSKQTENLSPKIKLPIAAVNSPHRKSSLIDTKKRSSETLKLISPRKTRSTSRDIAPSTSKASSIKEKVKPATVAKKDTLKNVFPSRSKSAEKKSPPNLQKLKRKAHEPAVVPPKTLRLETTESVKATTSRKRPSNAKEEVKKKILKKSEDSDDDSLKYFKKVNTSVTKKSPANTSSKIDRRILSTDDDDEEDEEKPEKASPKKAKGIDIWVEVYSEKDERWIAIDVFRGKIDCAKEVAEKATHPLVYVFAWNNDSSIKDVSARYCPKLNTVVRKMRVDREYLNSTLNFFPGTRTARDLKEDDELNKVQLKENMPTSIAEFKNHPIYALKRHLLKFQAIYPAEPPILGYIREEAIYPRDCVFVCRSRETWVKEARVVKLHEKPYKMTTTMKWDRAKNKVIKDVPLELFGIWQTKDFEPPVAENGVVPRNAYGNVELFKPCMLPINTVHLQLPSLNKVCKKIGVDCAQAVVGFDSSGGWPYPVYDGFIVCKEFEEKVIDAWNRDQEEMERKEQEKYEKRVYGNWKKLIKGLYIRERLKNKYNL